MMPSFQSQLDASLAVLHGLARQSDIIDAIAARVRDTVLAGHLLLTCGNGGSATDAQHLAEEMVG
ncbi:MAG TPA: SIS domain-containing protein, partial [Roseiflexaceae bacterium]